MKIKRLLITMSAIASVMSITAFASGWSWLDPNQDGVMECYYFNDDGTYLTNTATPDGYIVDSNGAWIQDGVVQTKGYGSGVLNQTVTTQVLSINPDFKTSDVAKAIDNTFGEVSIGALNEDGDLIETYHGAALWLGLDNRDYTLSEFKTILENSGATNISVEPDVRYNQKVGYYERTFAEQLAYKAPRERYGTLLRNEISFTLGGYNFRYLGSVQLKYDDSDTVIVDGIEGEFPDFIYSVNPYAVDWNVG